MTSFLDPRTHTNSHENDIPTSHRSKGVVKEEEEILTTWRKKRGVKITPEHRKIAKRLKLDPEFKAQWKKEMIARLKAKIARQRSQKLQSKLSQRKKKAIQLRNEIEQYLITVNGLAPNNQVKRIHVCDAIKVVKDVMDKRSVKNYLNDLSSELTSLPST